VIVFAADGSLGSSSMRGFVEQLFNSSISEKTPEYRAEQSKYMRDRRRRERERSDKLLKLR
jgi:hypothetical protein